MECGGKREGFMRLSKEKQKGKRKEGTKKSTPVMHKYTIVGKER